jgi:hypothetical protein
MLLRHATGTGAWPDPALFDAVPDGRLTGMAGDMLRSARLWRVAGGALVGEEQGP